MGWRDGIPPYSSFAGAPYKQAKKGEEKQGLPNEAVLLYNRNASFNGKVPHSAESEITTRRTLASIGQEWRSWQSDQVRMSSFLLEIISAIGGTWLIISCDLSKALLRALKGTLPIAIDTCGIFSRKPSSFMISR